MQITEQPSLYDHLEKKSVREILEDINQEDQKVALAVQKAIPQIEELVNQIVPRMKQGGRIFYMGAGTSGRLGVLDASEIPPTFGMSPNWIIGLIAGGDTALRNPVEGAEDDENRGWEELVEHQINEKDTVIGIAASGTTPYVIGALREARKHGVVSVSAYSLFRVLSSVIIADHFLVIHEPVVRRAFLFLVGCVVRLPGIAARLDGKKYRSVARMIFFLSTCPQGCLAHSVRQTAIFAARNGNA